MSWSSRHVSSAQVAPGNKVLQGRPSLLGQSDNAERDHVRRRGWAPNARNHGRFEYPRRYTRTYKRPSIGNVMREVGEEWSSAQRSDGQSERSSRGSIGNGGLRKRSSFVGQARDEP